MAALDFPDNPATGDLYGSSGTVWRWDGARWASTAGASGARGRVAYAQITTPQSGITNGDIVGLTATWTADPTRTYRTTIKVDVSSTVGTGDIASVFVHTGSASKGYAVDRLSSTYAQTFIAQAVETGLSGAITRKAVLYRGAGTGTLTAGCAADNPAFILVEDITYEAGSSGVGIEPTAWVYPTLGNGWNPNPGGGMGSLRYRKTGDMVHMEGSATAGTYQVAAFTLPVGFRPPADRYFAAVSGTTPVALIIGGVTAGTVLPWAGAAGVAFNFQCQFSVTP